MSGFGVHLRKADYVPKPLIELEDKPIIAHVIGLAPGESEFSFAVTVTTDGKADQT
jgi:NDP-sugar pyrophosphorylase family protein